MSRKTLREPRSLRSSALVLALAGFALSACATAVKPDGADRVRAELTTLQTNPEYASRAPVASRPPRLARLDKHPSVRVPRGPQCPERPQHHGADRARL